MEPHSGLNNLDYIVIGIVLLSGLLSLMRGFLREVFSLIAWVGAYFAAVKFYHLVLPLTHHYIKSDKPAEWAAMATVYIIALIILMIIGSLVCGLVKGRTLTSIDRSLGFVYGLARGILVVCLMYLGVVMILWPDIDTIDAPVPAEQTPQLDKERNTPPDLLMLAKTRPALASGAKILKGLIPKDMLDKTLKNADPRNNPDFKRALDQHMLDKMSTPAPPGEGGGMPIDSSKPAVQGTTP